MNVPTYFNAVKTEFEEVLTILASRKLSQNPNRDQEEIEHILLWLGDLAIVYISKLNYGKETISMEVCFPELKNLECLSHKIGTGYTSIPPF